MSLFDYITWSTVALATSLLLTFKVVKFIYGEWSSPLNILPGPKSSSLLFGNLKQIWNSEPYALEEQWLEEYGPAVVYKGLFGMNQLFTIDHKVVNHILMNPDLYQKPVAARKNMERIMGPGLVVVEGEPHRRQRKVMNPAFAASQVRELTPVFFEKVNQLKDNWTSQLSSSGNDTRPVEALSWLSKVTLNVIGLAGFHYDFEALSKGAQENELNSAFSTIFQTGGRMTMFNVLRNFVPYLNKLPLKRNRDSQHAGEVLSKISRRLLRESQEALGHSPDSKVPGTTGKDLLSILVRANSSEDVPLEQRLSDEDVLAQIATFLVAGYETTSTEATWALYALATHPEIQTKLRKELRSVNEEEPTMDQLNNLSYLDAFIREVLRLFPAIASKIRVAMEDDLLPLSQPIKARDGRMINGIPVRKGQIVNIPIMSLNRAKSVWGDDAHEFKPERWMSLPKETSVIPGVWGNTLTFLGGPRSCIGYRFSLTELKVIVFVLVKEFEFRLAVPKEDIKQKTALFLRPFVASDPKGGNQMPLIIQHSDNH
ncbi:cytochrome P450 [Panaeolus papilionaceus]|nr:cytochrome P450 [Panaeolus papilionaceus]